MIKTKERKKGTDWTDLFFMRGAFPFSLNRYIQV